MNIYCIKMYDKATADHMVKSHIDEVSFAFFSALGTWEGPDGLCDHCQNHAKDYAEPLLMQWEPSTDFIGDFSWDGPWGYLFVATEPVVEFFQQHGFGGNFLGVEYVEPEVSKRYKGVPYPYAGPRQFWGRCETFVDLDIEASGVEETEACPLCGVKDYTFKYEGIVIRRSNWHGEKVFRITTNGKSKATFVTEEGRRLIEEAGFSNVAFRPAGEIVG